MKKAETGKPVLKMYDYFVDPDRRILIRLSATEAEQYCPGARKVWQADPEDAMDLYGCTQAEAAESEYEIPEHAEGFPPSAIFATATDDLVNPNHSRKLAKALEELSIPCRLEIGPEGGHGFADGTGMCMEGWTERAVRWVQSMNN